MKFKEVHRFSEPYWFSGIYKIVEYKWYQNNPSEPYYHAYYLPPGNKNWGNYVGGRSAQHNKQLTFDECVKLCEEHDKEYEPTPKQSKQAEIARSKWIN